MKLFLVFLIVLLTNAHAIAAPGVDRKAPMGDRTAMFDKLLYSNPQKTVEFEYYLLGPKKIKEGAKYPLIVVLHAQNGTAYGGYILADQIANQGMPAFVIVPVVGPKVNDWATPLFQSADAKMPKPIDHVAELTKHLINKLPIDASRIYVTGYAMGGVGTFAALYYYPDIFTAGIPICGGWPAEDAKRFIYKPLWVFHGAEDSVVPMKETKDISDAINKLGGKVDYTLYPDVNHDSWVRAYEEPKLWTWLFSQKAAQGSAQNNPPAVPQVENEPDPKKIIHTAGPPPKTAPKAQKMP